MEALSKYYKILQLHSPNPIAKACPSAQAHLAAEYPDFAESEPIKDRNLQRLLKRELDQGSIVAALCLRCYVSYTVVLVCQRIVSLYGERYGFRLEDLTPIVLTDDGELDLEITRTPKLSLQRPVKQRPVKHSSESGDRFQPLSYSILEKFDPEKSGLNTWTTRLTRQNQKLKEFLRDEYKILLISDWALLNTTQINPLKRLLIKYFNFSENETPIQDAILLLHAYRKVYLKKYQLQKNTQTRCPDPTPNEYAEMITLLTPEFFTHCLQNLEPLDDPKLNEIQIRDEKAEHLKRKLSELAIYLRHHRLKQYPPITFQPPTTDYSEVFSPYLKKAIVDIIQARLTTKRITPEKQKNFLIALHLLYREGKTQTEIAQILGFPRQDTVAKLLNLKALTIGLSCHMLTHLKHDIPTIAQACLDPDQLLKVQSSLDEYLQTVMLEDEKWRYTTPSFRAGNSQFGELLDTVLDQCLDLYPDRCNIN